MGGDTGGPAQGRVAIVRVTTRCVCECRHCCFECSPRRDDFMPVEVARKVAEVFGPRVVWFNVMGGEVMLHPRWADVLRALNVAPMRVVTNGFWVRDRKRREEFVEVIRSLENVVVGVSRDRMHPPGLGDQAFKFLRNAGLRDDWGLTATKDADEEERAIVPVGRAYWNELGDGMLRMFGAYCQGRTSRKSMCVTEDGAVNFCPFGIWPLGELGVDTFEEMEAERERMDGVFKPSCVACYRAWLWSEPGRAEEARRRAKRRPVS